MSVDPRASRPGASVRTYARWRHFLRGVWGRLRAKAAFAAILSSGVPAPDPEDVRRLLPDDTLDELRTESGRFDFAPWVITGCEPTGEGFKEWRRGFLERYDDRRRVR